MDLRRLLNVAHAALMSSLEEEQRVEWHEQTEEDAPKPGAAKEKPRGKNVGALMRLAGTMPRK